MKYKSFYLFIYLLLFSLLFNCATVPKEAVTLSEEMFNMIRSAEQSHLAIIEQYMNDKRTEVDHFLKEEWIPKFSENALERANFIKLFEKETNAQERLKLIQEFAEDANKTIAERRQTMMDGIDRVEKILIKEVTEHYDNIYLINQALTGHLKSVADVVETREDLLNKLNITPSQIIPLDEINAKLGEMIITAGKVGEVKETVKDNFEKIQQILNEAKKLKLGGK